MNTNGQSWSSQTTPQELYIDHYSQYDIPSPAPADFRTDSQQGYSLQAPPEPNSYSSLSNWDFEPQTASPFLQEQRGYQYLQHTQYPQHVEPHPNQTDFMSIGYNTEIGFPAEFKSISEMSRPISTTAAYPFPTTRPSSVIASGSPPHDFANGQMYASQAVPQSSPVQHAQPSYPPSILPGASIPPPSRPLTHQSSVSGSVPISTLLRQKHSSRSSIPSSPSRLQSEHPTHRVSRSSRLGYPDGSPVMNIAVRGSKPQRVLSPTSRAESTRSSDRENADLPINCASPSHRATESPHYVVNSSSSSPIPSSNSTVVALSPPKSSKLSPAQISEIPAVSSAAELARLIAHPPPVPADPNYSEDEANKYFERLLELMMNIPVNNVMHVSGQVHEELLTMGAENSPAFTSGV